MTPCFSHKAAGKTGIQSRAAWRLPKEIETSLRSLVQYLLEMWLLQGYQCMPADVARRPAGVGTMALHHSNACSTCCRCSQAAASLPR